MTKRKLLTGPNACARVPSLNKLIRSKASRQKIQKQSTKENRGKAEFERRGDVSWREKPFDYSCHEQQWYGSYQEADRTLSRIGYSITSREQAGNEESASEFETSSPGDENGWNFEYSVRGNETPER